MVLPSLTCCFQCVVCFVLLFDGCFVVVRFVLSSFVLLCVRVLLCVLLFFVVCCRRFIVFVFIVFCFDFVVFVFVMCVVSR